MPTELSSLQANRILPALPPDELSRIADDLELITLPAGRTLYKPGDTPQFAYFPVNCVVSMICTTEDGSTSAVAVTGRDGMLDISLVLGGNTAICKVVVQCEGQAYRLRAEALCWELDQGGNLRRLALGYIEALLAQIAQNVLCNRYHSVEQQLCRWLLLNIDLASGNQLNATQETIANLLGVRREGVTEAARKLKAASLIRYGRGQITVMDRAGLEARVCECYKVVKTEYERLFTNVTAPRRLRPAPAPQGQQTQARLSQMQELQMHQLELEMDNRALRQAYEEADALREKYADIYDFAPVAYFSVDAAGIILQINLAGAILLGLKRSEMTCARFSDSIEPSSLPRFMAFFNAVISGRSRQTCEVTLLATHQRPEAFVKIEAIADDSGTEYRMVVVDITEQIRKARARA